MQKVEARRTIDPALEPGEELQWCGGPVTGRLAARRVGGLLLRLVPVGVVAYYLLPSLRGAPGAGDGGLHFLIDAISRDARLLVPSGVVAALLVGFVALLALDRRRLRHTAYAITDRRLLAVVGPRAKVPWSLAPESVAYVKVKDLGGGMSDVRFNRILRTQGRGSRSADRLYTFERMEDADRLARQVRNWLADQEPAALADARTVRQFADRELGFELRVPASWGEDPQPDAHAAFHVLSSSGGVRPRTEGSRKVLELYGPLGAAFSLDVAPAGTWTLEQAGNVGSRFARLLLKVVEGPEELRDAPAPGFRVTYETRRVQTLRGSRGSSPGWSVDVRIEFIILEHRGSQLRFALSWMSRFERMKEVLEEVVRSFEPTGHPTHRD